VTSTPTDGEQAVTQDLGLLTLEVTPRQALQITHAQNGAGIAYLSLNPQSFDVEDFEIPTEIVEAVNWFDQELTFAAQVAASIPDANQ
jgi:hypothetical protein